MSKFIQPLEQRVLMSVSAANLTSDAATIRSDVAALKAAHVARYTAAHNTIVAVKADLKVLDTSSNRAANNRLVGQLDRTALIAHARIVSSLNILTAKANLLTVLGAVQGKQLLAHPARTNLQKAVAKDIPNLETQIPARVTALENALTNEATSVDSVFTSIANANPSVASIIQSGENSVAAKTTAVDAAANQLEAATTALANDLAAISAQSV